MAAPMDSHVLVRAFGPVPGQDFVSSTADELHVLTRRSLLNSSSLVACLRRIHQGSAESVPGAGTTLLKRPQGERPSGPTSGKVRLHSWHSTHHRCRALSDVRKFRSRHIAALNINSD